MIGSGENGQLTFIDLLSIVSFMVGVQNLNLNIDQNDMDSQTREINERANALVGNAIAEIHAHLEKQDQKIDLILKELSHENHKMPVGND